LGIKLDNLKNENNEELISGNSSRVKVFRISTNEELVIAIDTAEIAASAVN
jgi:acetate kinase